MNDLFSINGRLRRKEYFLRFIFFMVGITVLGARVENLDENSVLAIGLSFIIIFILVLLFMQDIKRLHDMNKSGWLVLINFIPIINLVFMIYLLLNPGTDGENRFGEDPRFVS